jgi:hypothetical protein
LRGIWRDWPGCRFRRQAKGHFFTVIDSPNLLFAERVKGEVQPKGLVCL